MLMVTFDAVSTAFAVCAAWLIRFETQECPPSFAAPRRWTIAIVVCARTVALVGAGLHRWSFDLPGIPEGLRLLSVQIAGSLAFVAIVAALGIPVPRSIYPLEFLVSTALITGYRYLPSLLEERRRSWARLRGGATARTLIVGAGEAGELLAHDLRRSADSKYHLVGFVDDDPEKLGTQLAGRPVLGKLSDLPRLIQAHRASRVLLAIARLPPARIRELLAACASSKARFKIIPASFTVLDDRISAAMLHDLSAEDLLPRAAVAFDPREIRDRVQDRNILVTGAGGSIGSEIARQLAMHGARTLVLVDLNENELYLTALRLGELYPGVTIRCEVADIREWRRLLRLGERYRPHYVFHAAAHKHVPLMEYAPEEAIKNNVFGTRNVARMASRCGAERFVLISTDKAVRPTSVMGASKRVAELVVRDVARRSATRMTSVRFGNVLGSAGSVVPIFKRQIAQGGPVTVTHPECTRYFMTIPEAVGLVLVAGLRCEGDLCVLDMGEPIRIVDLARSLITMAGRVPGEEIPIVYTGLRPGEKLYEELLTEEEERTEQVRDRIHVARGLAPPRRFRERLAELRRAARAGDSDRLLELLRELVPTYTVTRNEAGTVAGVDVPDRDRQDDRLPAPVIDLRPGGPRGGSHLKEGSP
ncbi:polysaccharide biosynthesis protein CapD [Anaeromyxobacter oryzae]|uniref:Polysaccharide biosynthesis protein CapD n=2 Tax=Anaeromyxobacter oryzae TaxID=2918170 RepID=A0ABM7WS46_9BACT|nr:polysaccharide biosynthesis protein CapD [Anaeromyxobacter oryzae]